MSEHAPLTESPPPPSKEPTSQFGKLAFTALPLLAAQFFYFIQSTYAHVDFSIQTQGELANTIRLSLENTVVIAGLFVSVIMGTVMDRVRQSRRLITAIALICAAIGFILILVFDDTASKREMGSDGDFWNWLGVTIPGYILSEGAIVVLTLIGRAQLVEQFPGEQMVAQSTATSLQFAVDFLLRLIFYLVARGGSDPWPFGRGRGMTITAEVLGLLVGVLAVIRMPDDAGSPSGGDWTAILNVEAFPQFLHIVLPAAAAAMCRHCLEMTLPGAFVTVAESKKHPWHWYYFTGQIGQSIMALVAAAASFIGGRKLGARPAVVLSLMFSGIAGLFDIYAKTTGGVVVIAMLAGIGIGITDAVTWAVLADEVPRDALFKFSGLFIASLVFARPLALGIPDLIGLPESFLLAGFLGFLLPNGPAVADTSLVGEPGKSYT